MAKELIKNCFGKILKSVGKRVHITNAEGSFKARTGRISKVLLGLEDVLILFLEGDDSAYCCTNILRPQKGHSLDNAFIEFLDEEASPTDSEYGPEMKLVDAFNQKLIEIGQKVQINGIEGIVYEFDNGLFMMHNNENLKGAVGRTFDPKNEKYKYKYSRWFCRDAGHDIRLPSKSRLNPIVEKAKPIKSMCDNIVRCIKNRLLSADEKLLRKHGLKDENGIYTNNYERIVQDKANRAYEAEIVKDLKECEAEEKAEKK